MEHIDNDYLSTQVIQIPSKSKTSFSSCVYYSKCPTDKWRASVNSF